MDLGPVDILILRFPGNKFRGEILPALADLIERGTVRVIDLMFVYKDADGAVGHFQLAGLAKEYSSDFLNLVLPISGGLFDEEDIAPVAEDLEPNSSAAVLMWENTWAAPFVNAVVAAKGEVVDQARVPRADVEAALEALTELS